MQLLPKGTACVAFEPQAARQMHARPKIRG